MSLLKWEFWSIHLEIANSVHAGMWVVWSAHVVMHYFFRWHAICQVNTCWGVLFVLAGMGEIWATCWDTCHDLAGMGWDWRTQVDIHFCFLAGKSMVWSTKLRSILFPRWHGIGLVVSSILCPPCNESHLVNTIWDPYCILAWMRLVWYNTGWDAFCVLF